MTKITIHKVILSDDGAEKYQAWTLGVNGITEIKIVQKEGPMSFIPYVQVWRGEKLFAEYCQHNIFGVLYEGETDVEI